MKYLEIRNDRQWTKVLSQVELDRSLVGNIRQYVSEALEEALTAELIEDDAIYGGKNIEDICQDEGISLKFFRDTFLPKELQNINLTDLGLIRLIATHGECPDCGFDLEADAGRMKCEECDYSISEIDYSLGNY